MKTFPMFLRMSNRRVIIVGGGEQAVQKVRLILKTEAQIIVVADMLEPELHALAQDGRIIWDCSAINAATFTDSALVFIATGCTRDDIAAHSIAKAAGALVNVVDQPDLCDAITPSIVDRDPIVVAIGTEGTAPVLARQIKTRMEQILEPRLGDLAALAGRMRDEASQKLAPRKRRDLWRWVFDGPARDQHARGSERAAAETIKQAIHTGDFEGQNTGFVALIGAGPGSKDLITLRGVQRLQEADVIYYDRQVEADILELARRDAERVYVGQAPGCHRWPQDKINQMLVRAAKRDQRVVYLKHGDVSDFGRTAEALTALHDANISVEIVPGVAAAPASAANADSARDERRLHKLGASQQA